MVTERYMSPGWQTHILMRGLRQNWKVLKQMIMRLRNVSIRI